MDNAVSMSFLRVMTRKGKAIWTHDFSRIKPMLKWDNNMGSVTMTYDAPLKKYLMVVTDGRNTISKFNTYILESCGDYRAVEAGGLYEGFRRAGLLCEFSVEVHQQGRKNGVASYSANFTNGSYGHKIEIDS